MTGGLPLRDAHKALTRHRIKDAARQLFQESDIASVSVDAIAVRAGAVRSTFYIHFKDKSDVLAALEDDYIRAIDACASSFPPHEATVDHLGEWLHNARLTLHRQEPGLRAHTNPANASDFAQNIVQAWRQGLSARAPAFSATQNGRRGACEVVLLNIIWATRTYWPRDDAELSRYGILAVSKHVHDFLRDVRFVK